METKEELVIRVNRKNSKAFLMEGLLCNNSKFYSTQFPLYPHLQRETKNHLQKKSCYSRDHQCRALHRLQQMI